MNISHISNEIEQVLLSAERPEVKLIQMYQCSSEDQRFVFISALIGKVIAQDRMLRHKKDPTAA
ncbi:hypothetical protein [Tatumella ptyseos]|uniref:Uncharacterized protein n=1 Tax=Tatumella ptyseos TaxID=82987 RepID=A0A2X5NQH1_9GAMM|nr:hypothetical protein [Tatumella ptyseos]SQK75761.1 Uncharacterised protein [Tatumella ptyseos]